MMEKLKYTKFKTLLISSFICISIIPVVLLGLFIFLFVLSAGEMASLRRN